MLCEKCKSNEYLVYCGEHYDTDEGYGSVYLCKKCYPDLVKKLKNRYSSHVSRCNNFYCLRCGGDGFRKKHTDCEHEDIGILKIKGTGYILKQFICEDCKNIIQDDSTGVN